MPVLGVAIVNVSEVCQALVFLQDMSRVVNSKMFF